MSFIHEKTSKLRGNGIEMKKLQDGRWPDTLFWRTVPHVSWENSAGGEIGQNLNYSCSSPRNQS